ncbi:FkbM family methyltransferase [Mucilaginibacter auburnensis]|uniref:FkbM family methyltransferase n=1 Tax=Mucilaginibacter auburnensis TaxID=1457233 RepID=A0A2H9VNQ4_9SPHI|nr:FkbM family methyltransferase [Mucilaginibacter auburnensis]PJJ79975.1 FkbM family methyltransferase [Mucilaginibacter auburnensis]
MAQHQTIIKPRGKDWQHKVLMSLSKSKDFPTRLRILGLLKRVFNLDLLKYETPSGLKLLIDFDDWVQTQIYYHGNYEPVSLALFKRIARNSRVILDLGAHIGQYALECAQDDKDQSKEIFAIEVNPKTFTYLLNNIQINKFRQVKPILGALSESNEILNISIPAYWNMGNTQISKTDEGLDSFSSASFNIYDLTKKYNLKTIDLVKLDVEGQEFNILVSFFKIGIYPRYVMFEFIPDAFSDANKVIALLKENGYEIRDVEGSMYFDGHSVLEQNLIGEKI